LKSGVAPPVAPGFRKLHLLYKPPSPRPDTPQMLAKVTEVKLSFSDRTGACAERRVFVGSGIERGLVVLCDSVPGHQFHPAKNTPVRPILVSY
jgi:hypothetical protein